MKVLLMAATFFEIEPAIAYFQKNYESISPFHFKKDEIDITIMLTSIGMPLTAFGLCFTLYRNKYDLLIQAGVAGAIDPTLQIGDVVEVVSECMADLGVEHQDGSFESVFDIGLLPKDEFPFREGRLWNQPEIERAFVPKVHGITVNKVHGSATSIEMLRKKFPFAQVESMEGAAFFLVGLQMHGHLLQLRGISNFVEPRNREAWDMKKAITNLNEVLVEVLNNL